MGGGRTVPWPAWEEWARVRDALRSPDPLEQREGIDMVAGWRARGRVPLGADITAALVEAAQQDASLAVSEHAVRLQYSLALVRMVNGITDTLQRGRVAVSVAGLAASACLPRLLVDLRHEATHNELPALAALRLGARHALAWLRSQYWDHQTAHLAACHARVAELIASIAASWQAAARKALGGGGGGGQDGAAAAGWADDADGDDGGGGDEPAGYAGAEGQRQRRMLMAELRGLVPPSHASVLVPAVLESPGLAAAAAEGVGVGGDGGAASPAAAAAAAAAALRSLLGQYPRLRALLLRAVTEQLCGPAPPQPADAALAAERLLAWLQRLLPDGAPAPAAAAPLAGKRRRKSAVAAAVPVQAGADGGAGRGRGPSDDAPPAAAAAAAAAAPPQLAELLAMLVRARQAAAASADDGAADCWDEARRSAASTISAALARARGQGARADTGAGPPLLVALVRLAAPAGGADGPGRGGLDEAAGPSACEAAAERQRELLAQLRQPQPAPKAQAAEAQPAGPAAGTGRWRRAERWRPCALGALPCAHDPSGRLPVLRSARAMPVSVPAAAPQQPQWPAAAEPAQLDDAEPLPEPAAEPEPAVRTGEEPRGDAGAWRLGRWQLSAQESLRLAASVAPL